MGIIPRPDSDAFAGGCPTFDNGPVSGRRINRLGFWPHVRDMNPRASPFTLDALMQGINAAGCARADRQPVAAVVGGQEFGDDFRLVAFKECNLTGGELTERLDNQIVAVGLQMKTGLMDVGR